MSTPLLYRLMQPGEETAVYDMVAAVFSQFVAPDYSPEGVQEFLKYAGGLAERSKSNHFVPLAVAQGQIAGMIEVRNYDHISMLFVGRDYQGQGISRALLDRALERCRREKPELSAVTVNSSPYAISIYVRLGFRATGPEQVIHGIRFTPMSLPVTANSRGR
jgi:GNAT superfamily N-acetyltransferase